MGMTFFVGNTKLADGQAIKHERQNLRPGDPILTKDGGTLPNGTYTDTAGKSFTVKEGKVGQINVKVEPVVAVEPVVVVEPVVEVVKIEPVVEVVKVEPIVPVVVEPIVVPVVNIETPIV